MEWLREGVLLKGGLGIRSSFEAVKKELTTEGEILKRAGER